MDSAAENALAKAEIQERWVSGHLYRHQELDSVVREFVHPLVASLVKEGRIDGFFFVRYALGGPHVRLRVREVPGHKRPIEEAMNQAAEQFLERNPSIRTIEEKAIERANNLILASDPHETDTTVYPDNSFLLLPFHPEIERYGGVGLLLSSLDFFTLSSLAALKYLDSNATSPRTAQLAHASGLLLQQALGFASDQEELSELLGYGLASWGDKMPKVIEKGDKVARAQKEIFLHLFRTSISRVDSVLDGFESKGNASDFLIWGARKLSATIGSVDRETRKRIGGSHLHMTGSRLGLTNAEEVYISRLLTVTLAEIHTTQGQTLSNLAKTLASPSVDGGNLGSLLPKALATLTTDSLR